MTVTFTSWVPLVNQPIHMTITWPTIYFQFDARPQSMNHRANVGHGHRTVVSPPSIINCKVRDNQWKVSQYYVLPDSWIRIEFLEALKPVDLVSVNQCPCPEGAVDGSVGAEMWDVLSRRREISYWERYVWVCVEVGEWGRWGEWGRGEGDGKEWRSKVILLCTQGEFKCLHCLIFTLFNFYIV